MRDKINRIYKTESQLKLYAEIYKNGLSFSEQYVFAKDGKVLSI